MIITECSAHFLITLVILHFEVIFKVKFVFAFVIKEVTGDHVMFVSITICGQLDD